MLLVEFILLKGVILPMSIFCIMAIIDAYPLVGNAQRLAHSAIPSIG
jgi:hypothetical protein